MESVTLNETEQRKAQILARLVSGSLSTGQAATLLGLSQRQARRLCARYQKEGMAAVLHGNRQRQPHNKTDAATVAQVMTLAGEGGPYFGFSACHLQEMLAQRHDLHIGRSTLDRLLKEQGIKKCRKRAIQRRPHQKRERQPAEGMLLQIDGSLHDWLEGRGRKLCLVGAIDDATGKVLYLHFHLSETQEAYLLLLRTIAQERGLPMAAYHDKHTILRSPKKATIEDELAGTAPMSQVQRVLHELGIESIAAQSPQAKGRVERLWGTLQDRLVKEMRLEAVADQDAANAFLPGFVARFNARFAVAAADPESVWVPLDDGFDLARHFSTKQFRTVKSDQTLSFLGRTLLLCEKRSFAGERVAVCVTPEGQTFLYGGQGAKMRLSFRIVAPPEQQRPQAKLPTSAKAVSPAAKTEVKTAPGKSAWLHGRWTKSLSS